MNVKQFGMAVLISTLAVSLITQSLNAQGNGNGNGNGGGGGAEYTIIPFSPPDVISKRSHVTDLNDMGQAVGAAELNNGDSLAVHFDIDSEEYTLLAGGSYAEEVNNFNQIVGSYADPVGLAVALFWSNPEAAPVVIPPLDGHSLSFCTAINDTGVIVGYSYNSTLSGLVGNGFVCRTMIDLNGNVTITTPVPLDPLANDGICAAVDISEFVDGVAMITGDSADTDERFSEGVVWQIEIDGMDVLGNPALPEPVGALGLSDTSQSYAYAINNLFDVCGMSDEQPFLALAGGPPLALPLTRDSDGGSAFNVNDFGEVVGELNILLRWSSGSVPNPHAAIWRNGKASLLEKKISKRAGWESLWSAHVINDDGVIGGRGYFDVNSRGFLMFPNQ